MEIGIGLDVGGTKILGCAVDEQGNIVAEARVDSPQGRDEFLGALEGAVVQLAESLGDHASDVVGVGAGLPGLVDAAGVLHETPNIPAIEGMDALGELRHRVQSAFRSRAAERPIGVLVDNDATAAAAGEVAFGAARGVTDAVVVTLGTGIGGGIVAQGRLVRGKRGFAGEIGHIVVEADGPPCACGSRGCWEQFASGSGLARLGRAALAAGDSPGLQSLVEDTSAVRGEDVVAAARAGDPACVTIVDVFARYLALGLSNLAEVLDPQRFVLAGGLVRSGDLLFSSLPEHFARYRRGSGERAVEIVEADLGELAGAIGAAALALGVIK